MFPSLRKALLLLKKKRYQEQLLDKTENQISNLERMVSLALGWGCIPWNSIPAGRSWQVLSPLSKGKYLQNCVCATIFPGDTE